MSDVTVYSARPEHVLAAVTRLQEHGIACRVVQGPPMMFPWVLVALPSSRVVVPDALAERALAVLQPLQAAEASSARPFARAVRWRLLAIAISAVGAVAFLTGTIGGPQSSQPIAALVCIVVAIVAFRGLRKAAPLRRGEVKLADKLAAMRGGLPRQPREPRDD